MPRVGEQEIDRWLRWLRERAALQQRTRIHSVPAVLSRTRFKYLPGKTLTESNWPTFSGYGRLVPVALNNFGARIYCTSSTVALKLLS